MIRKLKNTVHLLQAILANLLYNFPSRKLTVIGVTGTDGKTTTVHLIHHILCLSGLKADLISTVSAPGLHTTTPDSLVLQRLIRKMVDRGTKYLVLEATSHGLDQHRLWGIRFRVGVITNVTHEHLDYHRTYENYLAAKAKLFCGVGTAILNRDDQSFGNLKLKISRACCSAIENSKVVTYGINHQADFTPQNFHFQTSLPGEYNQYNCLAAIATASAVGVPAEKIRKAVASFKGVIGRMEEISEGQNFRFIVDFAHTPNGLENVLRTLNLQLITHNRKTGKLIVVFGCAGLRDARKRPMMGEIAGRLADVAILTAEDPRTENVNDIIEQIAAGCRKAGGVEGKTFFRVPDRREAIKFAVGLAKKGDIVVICGKGHERSMCFGTTEIPWSDQEEVRKALK